MRVVIVQPPRLYWAFINDYDNFMVPQAPPALAAVARAAGHEVTILDCLPMKMGWKSLEARLRSLRPDVVAAGELPILDHRQDGAAPVPGRGFCALRLVDEPGPVVLVLREADVIAMVDRQSHQAIGVPIE